MLSRPLDALIASDPGLSRLRMGLAGACCVAANLAAEALLGTALHLEPAALLPTMILGAVIAMIGSNALARPMARESLRAALFFPVAMGVGLVVGTLVGGSLWLSHLVFVLVMFGAVYVRRFGLDFFFYGFLLWMGFFFSLFLRPTPDQLPHLMLAVVVGTAVVALLCTTVFRPHPRRTLARVFRSMVARRSRLLRLMASRLRAQSERDRDRLTRRVFDERQLFDEMVLMSDGWAASARALPVGWSAETLRRSLLEGQLSLDLVGWASLHLMQAPPRVRSLAARALVHLADGEDESARRVAALLERMMAREGAPGQGPAADGAMDAERLRREVRSLARGIDELVQRPADPHLPPDLERNAEFTPAAALTGLGMLPGPPSVAKDVRARGARWNPVVRTQATTRQAVQVAIAGALAILAGTLISDSRYYWAVIAAFVVFTGTGTRMDSFGKSLNRVIGTVLGLVVGIALAALTAGHPMIELAVILISVFCGFYLIRISYAYMMLFVTILVAQLYGILGLFSDALLLLRLAETVAGAGIGVLVALLFAPVSTRDTVARAEREVAASIGDLMEGTARALRDPGPGTPHEVDALLLATIGARRRLALAAAPMTRYHLTEHRPRRVRRRLTVVATSVSIARTVTSRVMARTASEGPMDPTAPTAPTAPTVPADARTVDPRVADACDAVAALARDVADEERVAEVSAVVGAARASEDRPMGSPAAPSTPSTTGAHAARTARTWEDETLEQLSMLARSLREIGHPAAR
nr:FUSC family protein [Brachybacterium halotolerans]